jgi:plastocyanin
MRRTALLLATLCLAAAGCGGDDDAKSSDRQQVNPTGQSGGGASESGGGGATAQGTVQIKMQNIQFNPKSANVKVGQKVVWTNEDDAPHNVIGGPLKSETFNKGEEYDYTPDKAGTIKYECTIHPGMDGTLVVAEG